MSDTNHQIHLALRTAAGHARAATEVLGTAEKSFEMKMKSAGASVWEAWGLAVRAQPEYAGRKIDDKALVRIYGSTKARPWWDSHLAQIKVAGKPGDRDWAKRTAQWHLDPDAARARRAQALVRSEARSRRVKEALKRGQGEFQGGSTPRPEPKAKDFKEIVVEVAKEKWGRDMPSGAKPEPSKGEEEVHGGNLTGLLARLAAAVRRADPANHPEVVAALMDAIATVEEL